MSAPPADGQNVDMIRRLFKLGLLDAAMIPVIVIFLFMAVFDAIGTLIGVSDQAGLLKDGKLLTGRAREVSILVYALGDLILARYLFV